MNQSNGLNNVVYTCGRCNMFYYEYKQLLEHLYWRHGTESTWCNKCCLKQWSYAAHVCHILPIEETLLETSKTYCLCGKERDSPMIGCDAPKCELQWYHFECVGIVLAPEGNWYCPPCNKQWALKEQQN